jgi:hypothetical protein
MCSRSSADAMFTMPFAPPYTTTSSLINLSVYIFSILVINYNPTPGFTKPATSKVFPRLKITSAAHPLK